MQLYRCVPLDAVRWTGECGYGMVVNWEGGLVCEMGCIGGVVVRGTTADRRCCLVYFQLHADGAVADAADDEFVARPLAFGVFGSRISICVYAERDFLIPWTTPMTRAAIAAIAGYAWRLHKRCKRVSRIYATQFAWDVRRERVCIIGCGHTTGEMGLDYARQHEIAQQGALRDVERMVGCLMRARHSGDECGAWALSVIRESKKTYGALWVSQMRDTLATLGVKVDKEADANNKEGGNRDGDGRNGRGCVCC